MDLPEIKARMKAKGFRQVDLSALLGLEPTIVSKALNGTRRITVPEMDKIRDWLRDPEVDEEPARSIPIIGLVAAGNWREAVQRSSHGMPSPDPSIPSRAFALKVSGDSMDQLVDDGGTVVVDPDDRALYPGRYYVIQNAEGEATFKRFLSDPARLVPCSSNPAHTELEIGSGEAFTVVGRVIWRAARM